MKTSLLNYSYKIKSLNTFSKVGNKKTRPEKTQGGFCNSE
jgi:hypothetical protein